MNVGNWVDPNWRHKLTNALIGAGVLAIFGLIGTGLNSFMTKGTPPLYVFLGGGAVIGMLIGGVAYLVANNPARPGTENNADKETPSVTSVPLAVPSSTEASQTPPPPVISPAAMVSSEPIDNKKGLVFVSPSPAGSKEGDFSISVLQYYYSHENNQLVTNVQFANPGTTRRIVTMVIFTSWSDYMLPDDRRVLPNNSNPLMGGDTIHVEPGASSVLRTFLQTLNAEGFKAGDKFGLEVTTTTLNGGNNFASIDVLENGLERLQKPIEEVSLDEPWDKRKGRIRSASLGANPPDRMAYSTMTSSKLKEATEQYIQRLRKFDLRLRGEEYKAILLERDRIRKNNPPPPTPTASDEMNLQMRTDYRATNRREGKLRDNFQELFKRELLAEAGLLNEALKKKLEPEFDVESQKMAGKGTAEFGHFSGVNAVVDLIKYLEYMSQHLRPD